MEYYNKYKWNANKILGENVKKTNILKFSCITEPAMSVIFSWPLGQKKYIKFWLYI